MDQIEEVQCAICSIQVRAALCQPREFVYSMSCAGKNDTPVYDSVKEYYGKVVLKSEDLITNSCTVDRDTFTNEAKEAMKQLHPEVLSKYEVLWLLVCFSLPCCLTLLFMLTVFVGTETMVVGQYTLKQYLVARCWTLAQVQGLIALC